MNKYISILFCIISLQVYSKERYTITQYKVDKTLLDSAYTLFENELYIEANNVLKKHKSQINFGKHYLQARINYHFKKPFMAELNRAFELGFNFVDSSKFYLENQKLIDDGIQNQIEKQNQNPIKLAFQEISRLDQKYIKEDGLEPGSEEHRALLLKFDSLIDKHGWPSRSKYQFNGVGPVILLAHQDFTTPDLMMKYYNLISELCLDNKEDWMIADFILNQRYQWFGSKLRHPEVTTDTLMVEFTKQGRLDKPRTHPYFYSFTKKMVNAGHYKLEITVAKQYFIPEIKRLLYFYEEQLFMDEDTKLFLIENGFSLPKGLTDDRFSIKVHPDLKDNELVYQFVS